MCISNLRYSYKPGARGVTVNAIDGVTTSNNSYPSLFLAYIVQEYTDKVNYRQVSKYVLVSGFTARSPLCNHVVVALHAGSLGECRGCTVLRTTTRRYYLGNDRDNESPLTFLSDRLAACLTLSAINPRSRTFRDDHRDSFETLDNLRFVCML